MFLIHFPDNRWGWQLIEPVEDLPFICEIHKDEIYRILEEERDFCKCCPEVWFGCLVA